MIPILILFTAMAVACALLLLTARSRGPAGGDAPPDPGNGGGGDGGLPRGGDPQGPGAPSGDGAEPNWWPEFERQFAAYVQRQPAATRRAATPRRVAPGS